MGFLYGNDLSGHNLIQSCFCIVLLWKHDARWTKLHFCVNTFLLDHVVVLEPDFFEDSLVRL